MDTTIRLYGEGVKGTHPPRRGTEVADSLPAGIPAAAVDAARDTLGGALAIAESLPGELAAALVSAAQIAFVDALHFVAAVAAIVAALALRSVPARSEPESEGGTAEASATAD